MNSQQRAYIAGLIDADGSIMLQLKPRKGMKFLFRVKTVVVIYQDAKCFSELEKLHDILGTGYLYQRNDPICEIRIEGFTQVEKLLRRLKPYIRFKQDQVELLLKAIVILKQKPVKIGQFLEVCEIADLISARNYTSRNRKYTSQYVRSELMKHHLIPVTTRSLQFSG